MGPAAWVIKAVPRSCAPARGQVDRSSAAGLTRQDRPLPSVAAGPPFAQDTGGLHGLLTSPEFWLALGQIIIIDILLGGDNAVVIALACRKAAPAQRAKGIIWGTAGAIVLRVMLIASP